MKQDYYTDQEIGDDELDGTIESTSSPDIEEDNLDHRQVVLLLGRACQVKSLRTTRVPLPQKWIRAATVIAHPPLPNCWNRPEAMAAPLLKHPTAILLNKVSASDDALST